MDDLHERMEDLEPLLRNIVTDLNNATSIFERMCRSLGYCPL